MSFLVVDTDVVSYLLKSDTRARLYESDLDGNTLVVSFMTVAELRYWTRIRNWGESRMRQVETLLQGFVVHPSDDFLCKAWSELTYQARQQGRVLPCADAWIAATAMVYQVPLVTHNASDFKSLPGLQLITHS